MLTEQEPPTKVHVPWTKVTVPVGVVVVPGAVSTTVVVHISGILIVPVSGQETAVVVILRLTTTLVLPVLVS